MLHGEALAHHLDTHHVGGRRFADTAEERVVPVDDFRRLTHDADHHHDDGMTVPHTHRSDQE